VARCVGGAVEAAAVLADASGAEIRLITRTGPFDAGSEHSLDAHRVWSRDGVIGLDGLGPDVVIDPGVRARSQPSSLQVE
jgi:hypothetical protein